MMVVPPLMYYYVILALANAGTWGNYSFIGLSFIVVAESLYLARTNKERFWDFLFFVCLGILLVPGLSLAIRWLLSRPLIFLTPISQETIMGGFGPSSSFKNFTFSLIFSAPWLVLSFYIVLFLMERLSTREPGLFVRQPVESG